MFFILDSDHSMPHVCAELELLRPVTKPGDYVVVEDANIHGDPISPAGGPGPSEAVEKYFSRHPADYIRDEARENKFGLTFATRGFIVRH